MNDEFELVQPPDGYRFSIDAFLLAAFAARFDPQVILDMGTGCGVIAWQIQQLRPACSGIAVEIQDELIHYARQNLARTSMLLWHGDIRRYRHEGPLIDVVVSNPPYFKPGHGKISKNPVKAHARHTLNGHVVEWVGHIKNALQPNARICLVYPQRFRQELEEKMASAGYYINESIDVFSYETGPPKLCCLQFSAQKLTEKKAQLVLYHGHRQRTPQAVKFLAGTLQEGNFL